MAPDLIYDDVVVGRSEVNEIYARRCTFNRAPQHLYPTENNRLTDSLEAPYAHCLSNGVRYWTRDDALSDIRWIPRTDLPCLNCLLLGDVAVAKRCDRYTRQEAADGMERCCSQCEETWGTDACVELIEVRTTHLFETLPLHVDLSPSVRLDQPLSQHTKDIGIWSDKENRLRAEGSVAWRPINLSYGDVAIKAEVVASYERGTSRQIAPLEAVTYLGRPPCADRLKVARTLVETWDRIDSELSASQPTQETGTGDSDPPDEASDSIHCDSVEEEQEEQQDQGNDIDNDVLYWSETILGAACDLYLEQVRTFGRSDADKINDEWQRVSLQALAQIRRFFMIKQVMRKRGCSDGQATDVALDEMPEDIRGWFEELIPGMLKV